jgi:aspartate/methionine/tyrosine aminotransferase
VESLTRWEWRALEGGINLADGHARQLLGGHEEEIVEKLPGIYRDSYIISQREAERRFLMAYWRLVGLAKTDNDQRALFHYSSSLSIDSVAKFLRAAGYLTLLVSPTFDNIPAILRRNGVCIEPVMEDELAEISSTRLQSVDGAHPRAIFLVSPNNPTGFLLSKEQLQKICIQCRENKSLLVVDNSFRAFRPDQSYDDLTQITASGCSFISIEDTGKIFSTSDIKVGFTVSSHDVYAGLAAVTEEIMLNVSPFALLLLEAVANLLTLSGGLAKIRALVNANRASLERALFDTPLRLCRSGSPLGIGWAALPDDWRARSFVIWLAERDFGILPGNPFFWHDISLGDHYVRIALMREQTYFERAAIRLRELVTTYDPHTVGT